MSQSEIDRSVAEATGESVSTIRRRGFSLVTPLTLFDPDENLAQPQVVDWDRLEAERFGRAA